MVCPNICFHMQVIFHNISGNSLSKWPRGSYLFCPLKTFRTHGFVTLPQSLKTCPVDTALTVKTPYRTASSSMRRINLIKSSCSYFITTPRNLDEKYGVHINLFRFFLIDNKMFIFESNYKSNKA